MTEFTQEQNMMLEESAPTMLEEFAMPLLDLQKWLTGLVVPNDQLDQKNTQLILLAKIIDDLEHVEAPSDYDTSDDSEDDSEDEYEDDSEDEYDDDSEDKVLYSQN